MNEPATTLDQPHTPDPEAARLTRGLIQWRAMRTR